MVLESCPIRRNKTLDIQSYELASTLEREEKKVLTLLLKFGAAVPAELAVKSFSLPEEVNKTLRSLREKELIALERGTGPSSGEVITLNERGRRVASILTTMRSD